MLASFCGWGRHHTTPRSAGWGSNPATLDRCGFDGPSIDVARKTALRFLACHERLPEAVKNAAAVAACRQRRPRSTVKGVYTVKRHHTRCAPVLATAVLALPVGAHAQSGDAGLAQALTNPIADLISVPIQMNYDRNIGRADDGTKFTANVQPVIPFHINDDWNLITRTIVPVIYQDEMVPRAGSQFGLGDVNLSLFFSPKKPTAGGLIWGAGPVFLLPTATDSKLGGRKWAAGPGVVGLATRGRWTVGMLANHIWSFAGNADRQDISSTFAQPFVAYTWPSAWTVSAQSETSYNWKSDQWSIPVNVAVSKLVRIGKLPVSLQGGIGYWVDSPDAGPEGFRFRLQVNVVLPK